LVEGVLNTMVTDGDGKGDTAALRKSPTAILSNMLLNAASSGVL
jgi:hypothetical protein